MVFGALESGLHLSVKRNMSNWQIYICIFLKRPDSTLTDRFSGSSCFFFFFFFYFACSAVYIYLSESVRDTVRRRVHLKECYNAWLNFFLLLWKIKEVESVSRHISI